VRKDITIKDDSKFIGKNKKTLNKAKCIS